jgi:hypothetical protein
MAHPSSPRRIGPRVGGEQIFPSWVAATTTIAGGKVVGGLERFVPFVHGKSVAMEGLAFVTSMLTSVPRQLWDGYLKKSFPLKLTSQALEARCLITYKLPSALSLMYYFSSPNRVQLCLEALSPSEAGMVCADRVLRITLRAVVRRAHHKSTLCSHASFQLVHLQITELLGCAFKGLNIKEGKG